MTMFGKKKEEEKKPYKRYLVIATDGDVVRFMQSVSNEIEGNDLAKKWKMELPNTRVLLLKVLSEAMFPKDINITMEDFEGF